ncbi:YjbF family lipoprotein [Variovorax ginsengisoli]|uniref:Uncharacterized protein n=1 Tax=Variovorax ginsengisoli TaxID=363844 RepID=A0ABT9SCW2_9BURK|nr:YjbF family lipoprotein [Variovorax ginsengisoli]MDP9902198.1 hypothetical protein [Variovorax ginsengisoli]
MIDSLKHIYPTKNADPAAVFNPQYSYLRTVINGSVNYLVLGYVDPAPEGAVEVWYSSAGEVVKLRDGHLAGTAGLPANWLAVRHAQPMPPATTLPTANQPITYARERDVMPGYRFGVRDQVTRVAVPAPAPGDTRLAGVPPSSLRWYEERSTSTRADGALPASRFAVSTGPGAPVVVYSEQCVTPDICLSFERWTPASP